ncbi:2-amino-3,7-dideoxy-D-threo-hept-6-ulosonate synthase [Streptomyces sulphureus]|uniref:2-amino-3,7-dideoxy-D-threo-hept-6-ulosonate synthase n=1 Tax=Streptomyces sulphureus TaxID=47758 RepID=UPI00039FAF84|nr:2-amino-3,7-dideoxy-D-threo-hept-6-ulosonate synthase [Streptomyces sulphureus]
MRPYGHFARSLRLRRLHHHTPDGLLITPLDHSLSDGPVVPKNSSIDLLAGQLAAGGVDGIVVHKGSVRHIHPERFADMSLVIHLNASTGQAPDPDAKYLVTEVEDALRLGADAVSVHVNLGSDDERRQIADLGRVSDACDRWNLPLLAMVYPRGPRIADPHDPALVAHAVTIAADLGVDLIKTCFPGSLHDLAALTEACPVPLLVAGGPQRGTEDGVLAFVDEVLAGGALGVAMGRNVFQSADPQRTAEQVARLVHRLPAPEPAAGPDHTPRGQQRDGEQAVLA